MGKRAQAMSRMVGGGGGPLQRYNSEEMDAQHIFHKFASMMIFFLFFIISFEKGYRHSLLYNIF